jgi:ABC-type glycerol-3-phosphate transport system permease component
MRNLASIAVRAALPTEFYFFTNLTTVLRDYRLFVALGLYDTRAGMVLTYSATCIPFGLFVFLRRFFIKGMVMSITT